MARRIRQLELPAPRTWGGKRKGAGRKRAKGRRPSVAHRSRPALSHHHPVHVTLRVLPHVWNLRSRRAFRAIGRTFLRNKERGGFRLVYFSVQGNHLHLIVEARDTQRLSSGMIGLATWTARRLNQMMGRSGKVFADRFHSRILRRPTEVAHAIGYVLGNFAVHARRWLERGGCADGGLFGAQEEQGAPRTHRAQGPPGAGPGRPDPYSSAGPDGQALTAAPLTWLLREGHLRSVHRL